MGATVRRQGLEFSVTCCFIYILRRSNCFCSCSNSVHFCGFLLISVAQVHQLLEGWMASIQQRGDSWFAQVRIKKGGVIVLSESKSFPTQALAQSWAKRLEDTVRTKGIPTRTLSVGDLILEHLQYAWYLTV